MPGMEWVFKLINEPALKMLKERRCLWRVIKRRGDRLVGHWRVNLGDGECGGKSKLPGMADIRVPS